MFTKYHFAATAAAFLAAGSVSAAQITGWSDTNVLTVSDSIGAGTSTIYDRAVPDTDARSSGVITFDGAETFSPGLKVVNDAASGDPDDAPGGGDVFNCIMASSAASCNSPRQSGKRFKLDRTGIDAIDLVFGTNPDGTFTTPGNDGLYKVFQKSGNATGCSLPDFTATLGTGIGTDFRASTADDGLRFFDFGADPKNSQFSSLFANGLFGSIDETHPLNGYFDVNRAGYGLQLTSADSFTSTGIFGAYNTLFGDLLSYTQVPNGVFYDDDGNAATDNVLLAHQLADGSWVQNRSLDSAGVVATIGYLNDGIAYADLDALLLALETSSGLAACDSADPGTPCLTGVDVIEDLAKFNLTYSIDPTQFMGTGFTLRLASVAAVPEPAGIAIFALGLGALGFARRNSRRYRVSAARCCPDTSSISGG